MSRSGVKLTSNDPGPEKSGPSTSGTTTGSIGAGGSDIASAAFPPTTNDPKITAIAAILLVTFFISFSFIFGFGFRNSHKGDELEIQI